MIPASFVGDPATAETLATFRTIAELHPESLGAFVISMTKAPSDVLAVYLLQVPSHDSGLGCSCVGETFVVVCVCVCVCGRVCVCV